jgi:hypothetical protein
LGLADSAACDETSGASSKVTRRANLDLKTDLVISLPMLFAGSFCKHLFLFHC